MIFEHFQAPQSGKDSVPGYKADGDLKLRKTELCRHGRGHQVIDERCCFAHSSCELAITPCQYTRLWSKGQCDRWIGHMLSDDQLQKMFRYFSEVMFCFMRHAVFCILHAHCTLAFERPRHLTNPCGLGACVGISVICPCWLMDLILGILGSLLTLRVQAASPTFTTIYGLDCL